MSQEPEVQQYTPDYDDTEKQPRCSMCGYQLLDAEIAFLKPKDPTSNMRFCTFHAKKILEVPELSIVGWFYWKVFRLADWRLYRQKVEYTVCRLHSQRAERLRYQIGILESVYRDEVFPAKYSEEKSPRQVEYQSIKDQLEDIYTDAIGDYHNILLQNEVKYARQASRLKKFKISEELRSLK